MRREQLMDRVRSTPRWDVIVIGGGATGLGAAVDAASRGYATLLIEKDDFAKGTSSRSTKLVHGGVRYLAQGNLSLVFEALHERGRMARNAPHVVGKLPFLVPGYNRWSNPYYGAGLTLYGLMAGKLGFGATRWVSKREALRRAPTLEPKGLTGGIVYWDGQFDDARLAVTLMRTVHDLDGLAVNYLPATGLIKENGRVGGVVACDAETGEEFRLHARAVINATGVYADTVRNLDEGDATEPMLSPSQGVHVVLDRSFLPGDHAIMVPKTDDGRVLFAVPWHDRVIVGTTDTPVDSIDAEPRALATEIDFVMSHAARYLTKDPVTSDVLSIYAGLRPLVKPRVDKKGTASISREHTLVTSPSGLVTITGGKWTTYRTMGAHAVDSAAEAGALAKRPSRTEDLRLHGFTTALAPAPLDVYGADAPDVQTLSHESPGWDAPLHPRLPYLAGEVTWAARHELARTVEDVLSRRTRALLLDARASIEAAPAVARLLATELGHDDAWATAQTAAYESLAQGYLLT